jgi:hypothetical protein
MITGRTIRDLSNTGVLCVNIICRPSPNLVVHAKCFDWKITAVCFVTAIDWKEEEIGC